MEEVGKAAAAEDKAKTAKAAENAKAAEKAKAAENNAKLSVMECARKKSKAKEEMVTKQGRYLVLS